MYHFAALAGESLLCFGEIQALEHLLKMETPADICAFIVRRGYFVDWQQPGGNRRGCQDRRNVDKPQPLLARGKHD